MSPFSDQNIRTTASPSKILKITQPSKIQNSGELFAQNYLTRESSIKATEIIEEPISKDPTISKYEIIEEEYFPESLLDHLHSNTSYRDMKHEFKTPVKSIPNLTGNFTQGRFRSCRKKDNYILLTPENLVQNEEEN